MIMNKIYLIIIFAFLLVSCGKDIEKDFNSYGGESRRNSYEFLGTFFNTVVKKSEFENPDSVTIIQNPLALKQNMVVSPTLDGKIYLSNIEGIKWKVQLLEDTTYVAAGMCADDEMNIYAISNAGILHSVDILGNVKLKMKIDDKERFETYTDLLFTDGNIYFASSSGDVKSVSPMGRIIWQKKFDGAVNSAVASGDNSIYFHVSQNTYGANDKLIRMSTSGEIIFEQEIQNFRFINNPSYFKGKIYSYGIMGRAENKQSYIFIHDSTGKEIKKIDFPITIRSISIDNDENIFVSAYNSGVAKAQTGVFKLDKEGKVLWKLYFRAKAETPILLSDKLACFMGITDEGPGIFFLDMLNGRVKKVLSMANSTAISPEYAVIQGPEIIFPTPYKFGFIRITNLAIDRILPF